MSDLLPCPFCGEELIHEGGYLDWFTHKPRPGRDKCIAHNINIVRSRRDRIELWNRRALAAAAPPPDRNDLLGGQGGRTAYPPATQRHTSEQK